MKTSTILVVGATGTVGSELVKQLKALGQNVKAPNKQQMNLVTGQGVKEAFEGVDKAFLLTPPGHADQHKVLSPLIQEAKRRGLKKVVLMTAMGANAVETAPLRKAEIELEKSGLNYNIIRPNWFFQNFNTFWLQGIREQGKILVPGGSAKVSFIDARDISAVAAKLLTSDEHNNKDFDLTGPESLDHNQAAAALSNATGKKIVYSEIEPAVLQKGLVGMGIPADYVDFMLMIFGFLRDGYNARTTNSVEQILGRKPADVNTYASAFKQAWM